MGFTPAFTSTWDAPLLNAILLQLRAGQGDLVDVSMVAEDESPIELNGLEGENTVELNGMDGESTVELNSMEGENTIELNSMEGENTVELNSMEDENTVELNSMEGENTVELNSMEGVEESSSEGGRYEMFESTILLENTIADSTVIDDNGASSDKSESDSDLSLKYIVGCPVHNHHMDSQSVCPDDAPCSCLM